jgi:L-fucose mutarotase
MLIGIPKIIPPELLKILMEMGHGDDLVIGDGNFPHASCAKRLVRCDGHQVPDLMEAILKLFPLDTYADTPASLMAVVPGDTVQPERWDTYSEIMEKYFISFSHFEYLDRCTFYERAAAAYAVVASGDQALYANIIIKKGVVT